jgi:hypothetical protein
MQAVADFLSDASGRAKTKRILVPGARIELATPAFSGRRSTSELPRHGSSLLILGSHGSGVKSTD